MGYYHKASGLSITSAITIALFIFSAMRLSFSLSAARSVDFRGIGRSSFKGLMQMSSESSTSIQQQTLSVAPMMAHTNKHFRTFWRFISKKSILYTEMVVAEQIIHAYNMNYLQVLDKHLGHNSLVEDPLVLQLGGNDPATLSKASAIAYTSGFQSINLNCGCPSNTVASTNSMGASMMFTPERTAECCAAIIEAERNYLVTKNVKVGSEYSNNNNNNNNNNNRDLHSTSDPDFKFSVKCRTGVDDLDSYEDLQNFVDIVSSQGGVKRFQIHARKALLGTSSMTSSVISLFAFLTSVPRTLLSLHSRPLSLFSLSLFLCLSFCLTHMSFCLCLSLTLSLSLSLSLSLPLFLSSPPSIPFHSYFQFRRIHYGK